MITADLLKSANELFDIQLPTTSVSLKKAYRQACLTNHPDRGGDEETFKEVQRVYEELVKYPSYIFTDADFQTQTIPLTREGIPLHELGLGLGSLVNGTDCPRCNHRGYLIEYGDHFRVCDYCNLGVVPREFPCRSCKGTGKYTQKRGRVVNCYRCKGTGKFKHPTHKMWCPKCHGGMTIRDTNKEKVYYIKCVHCDGKGELPMFNPVLPKGLLKASK